MSRISSLRGHSAREGAAWSPVRSAPFQSPAPHLSPPTWVLSVGDAESKPPAAAGFLSGLKLWGHGVGGVSLGWGGRERAVAAAETQMPSEQEIVANAVTGDRAGHSTCVPMPGPTPSACRSRVTQSLHARPAWGGFGRPSPCDSRRAARSVALRRPGCPAGRHANAHRGVPSAGSRSPWSARAPAHALARVHASPGPRPRPSLGVPRGQRGGTGRFRIVEQTSSKGQLASVLKRSCGRPRDTRWR